MFSAGIICVIVNYIWDPFSSLLGIVNSFSKHSSTRNLSIKMAKNIVKLAYSLKSSS